MTDAHGDSPTTLVYQSSWPLAQVVFPAHARELRDKTVAAQTQKNTLMPRPADRSMDIIGRDVDEQIEWGGGRMWEGGRGSRPRRIKVQ